MSQILKSLQLVTQSYNGTPSTGTGALYASGSDMYFENANGIIYPLGDRGFGGGYLIVREYTGSNPGGGDLTYTWSNPGNLRFLQVVCVGGGGGGGSGPFISVTLGSAGSGGGGGAISYGFFDKSDLTQTQYTIVVGGGGAGGGPRLTLPQSGLPGQSSQYTTFGGTLVSASGGGGGGGGAVGNTTIAGGVGGSSINSLPGPGFTIEGTIGGQAAANAGRHVSPSPMLSNTIPLVIPANAHIVQPVPLRGGAGGGAGDAYNGSSFNGGQIGSSGVVFGTVIPNNTTLANSGSNNLISGSYLFQFTGSIPFTTQYGLGGGGNGGTNNGSATGSAGGNGGLYGAGGGGSSISFGTQPSKAGGSGSSGLCIVLEYY